MSIMLSQLRWPSLAQDLALMTIPGSPLNEMGVIYAAYNITKPELIRILKIPQFREMVEEEVRKFKSQGKEAASMFRFKALSQSLGEKLYRDAMSDSGKMESKEAIKLLETLMKAGGMLSEAKNAAAATAQTQVNVGINLPIPVGLTNPKLNHVVDAIGAGA